MEAEVLVACVYYVTPEHGLPSLVGHVSVLCSMALLQILGEHYQGTLRVVLSHTLHMHEVCLFSLGLVDLECCAVVADGPAPVFGTCTCIGNVWSVSCQVPSVPLCLERAVTVLLCVIAGASEVAGFAF